MKEGLMPLPGYEHYWTDGLGNVWSTKRNKAKRLSATAIRSRGRKRYLRVKIAGETRLVHRIVATALVGRDLRSWETVNHIDGDTQNNCLDNLEVVTHAENVRHAVENGLYCSGPQWYAARGLEYPGTGGTFND